MILNANVGVSGAYRAQVIEDGEVVRDTGEFKNLITNYGLSLTSPFENTFMCVGAGVVTEPAYTDVNLGNEVARREYSHNFGDPVVISDASPWVLRRSATVDFTGIEADISEVGLRLASPGTLISRSLIKDPQGNPISISLKANQTFRLTYFVYTSFSDTMGSGTFQSADFGVINYTIKRKNIGQKPSTYSSGEGKGFAIADWANMLGIQLISSNNQYFQLLSTSLAEIGNSNRVYPSASGSARKATGNAYWPASSSNRTIKGVGIARYIYFVFDSPITILANHDFRISLSLSWGRA